MDEEKIEMSWEKKNILEDLNEATSLVKRAINILLDYVKTLDNRLEGGEAVLALDDLLEAYRKLIRVYIGVQCEM